MLRMNLFVQEVSKKIGLEKFAEELSSRKSFSFELSELSGVERKRPGILRGLMRDASIIIDNNYGRTNIVLGQINSGNNNEEFKEEFQRQDHNNFHTRYKHFEVLR
ncbi:hypothetical protein [Fervidobacterium thailandense]|uniref:hypothetical protein n=1 Tax=Fervidobacterium thailandense TaxID=1008305 RepID=UPI001112EF39|nr:hypothetical protein [Fervidobacterium thailandense]